MIFQLQVHPALVPDMELVLDYLWNFPWTRQGCRKRKSLQNSRHHQVYVRYCNKMKSILVENNTEFSEMKYYVHNDWNYIGIWIRVKGAILFFLLQMNLLQTCDPIQYGVPIRLTLKLIALIKIWTQVPHRVRESVEMLFTLNNVSDWILKNFFWILVRVSVSPNGLSHLNIVGINFLNCMQIYTFPRFYPHILTCHILW